MQLNHHYRLLLLPFFTKFATSFPTSADISSEISGTVFDIFNGTDGIYELLESDNISNAVAKIQVSAFLTMLFSQVYNDETELNYRLQNEILNQLENYGGLDDIVENLERNVLPYNEAWETTLTTETVTTGTVTTTEDQTENNSASEIGKLESSGVKIEVFTIICFTGMIIK